MGGLQNYQNLSMKLNRFFLLFTIFFCPFWLASQVVDDFNDGNFTENPAWAGTQSKFIINASLQLQLDDTQVTLIWLPRTVFAMMPNGIFG